MPTQASKRGSQRLTKVLDNTDKAAKVLGLRHSLYVGNTIEWITPEEEYSTNLGSIEHGNPRIPPPDKGSKACLFMLSAFIIEAVMWGKFIPISLLPTISFLLFSARIGLPELPLNFCFRFF